MKIQITAKYGHKLPEDLEDKLQQGFKRQERRGELEWTPAGWRVLPKGIKANRDAQEKRQS